VATGVEQVHGGGSKTLCKSERCLTAALLVESSLFSVSLLDSVNLKCGIQYYCRQNEAKNLAADRYDILERHDDGSEKQKHSNN
jgi:hypothetical protein